MKPIVKRMLAFIISLVIIYILLCLGLVFAQRSLIYFPVPAQSDRYARSTFTVAGIPIQFSVREYPSQRAIIYFGGNAEDTSVTMLELVELFKDNAIFAMHYRGYGGSGGKPSEAGLNADAQALYELVAGKYSEIIVIGRSLGSGIATRLASQNAVSKLILVTPFDSLANVAASKLPFVPVHWCLWDRFDSSKWASSVTAPVLVLAAADDEIIPPQSTRRLVEAFQPGQCHYVIIDAVDHNSLELPTETIRTFIAHSDFERGL